MVNINISITVYILMRGCTSEQKDWDVWIRSFHLFMGYLLNVTTLVQKHFYAYMSVAAINKALYVWPVPVNAASQQ